MSVETEIRWIWRFGSVFWPKIKGWFHKCHKFRIHHLDPFRISCFFFKQLAESRWSSFQDFFSDQSFQIFVDQGDELQSEKEGWRTHEMTSHLWTSHLVFSEFYLKDCIQLLNMRNYDETPFTIIHPGVRINECSPNNDCMMNFMWSKPHHDFHGSNQREFAFSFALVRLRSVPGSSEILPHRFIDSTQFSWLLVLVNMICYLLYIYIFI